MAHVFTDGEHILHDDSRPKPFSLLHDVAVHVTDPKQKAEHSGILWRAAVVGLVAAVVLLMNPIVGVVMVVFEVLYFGWLSQRTERPELGGHLLNLAAATGVTVFVVVTVLALTTGHAVPAP